MSLLRSTVIFLSVFCFCAASASAGRKVAIIVEGGDYGGELGTYLEDQANQAELRYRRENYEVIRVKDSEGATPADLRRIISQQGNVDALDMTILTHGAIRDAGEGFSSEQPLSAAEAARFPTSHLRLDEVDDRYGEHALESDSIRFAFIMSSAEDRNSGWIGLGDLHDALAELKRNNPTMRTTISTFACFGGNVIRAFENLPDTQVFAAASGDQSSIIYYSQKELRRESRMSTRGSFYSLQTGLYCEGAQCAQTPDQHDFVGLLQAELAKGANYLTAFLRAKKKLIDANIELEDFATSTPDDEPESKFVLPQTSLDLALSDHCLGPPSATEVPSFCQQRLSNGADDLGVLASELSQSEIRGFLTESIQESSRYFSTLLALNSCDEGQSEQEAKILQTAQQKFLNFAKNKYASISDGRIASEIASFNSKLARIPQITDVSTLLSLLPKNYDGVLMRTRIVTAKNRGALDLESEKEQLTAFYQRHISEPLSYEDLRDKLRKQFAALQSCDGDCIWEGLTKWPAPYDNLLEPIFPENIQSSGQAQLLINSACSSGSLNRAKDLKIARRLQLNCILNHTSQAPLLRVTALSATIRAFGSAEQDDRCEIPTRALQQQQSLLSCLNSLDSKDALWRRLEALYRQGMRKP